MDIYFPGDKSIAHRALLLGLLCDAAPKILNLPDNEDCRATQNAVNLIRANPRGCEIDCASSGTTLRLLMGLLAGREGKWMLLGSQQLDARPVERVAKPLCAMGADICVFTAERRRISICGRHSTGTGYLLSSTPSTSNRYLLEVASSQLKTALILAGLQVAGETVIVEPTPSRDHTERLVREWGGVCERHGHEIHVRRSCLMPKAMTLPGDFSTAAFAIAEALLVPGSDFVLKDVGLNPTRTGMLRALMRMGANISATVLQETWEPRGDIQVRYSPALRATTITTTEIPSLIDEVPILTVLALFAQGTSRFEGLSELRLKESNRLDGLVAELKKCGAQLAIEGDTLIINGGHPLHSAALDSLHDHRLAMAFAVLGLVIPGGVTIRNQDCVSKSDPAFWEKLALRQNPSTISPS